MRPSGGMRDAGGGGGGNGPFDRGDPRGGGGGAIPSYASRPLPFQEYHDTSLRGPPPFSGPSAPPSYQPLNSASMYDGNRSGGGGGGGSPMMNGGTNRGYSDRNGGGGGGRDTGRRETTQRYDPYARPPPPPLPAPAPSLYDGRGPSFDSGHQNQFNRFVLSLSLPPAFSLG